MARKTKKRRAKNAKRACIRVTFKCSCSKKGKGRMTVKASRACRKGR